jgi:hypothetical protein
MVSIMFVALIQTSVTASSAVGHSKPSAPKKAKLESSARSVHASGVPDTKPEQMKKRSAYRHTDLPTAVQADKRWTKRFLPTIMLWAGNYDDIWRIPDDVLLHHVQLIFDAVYKEFKITAVRGGVMHSLVSPPFHRLTTITMTGFISRQHNALWNGAVILARRQLSSSWTSCRGARNMIHATLRMNL